MPFMFNVYSTNVINLRDGDGKPKAFKEPDLFIKTLFTHFGFELKDDGKEDIDFPERRYRAAKII